MIWVLFLCVAAVVAAYGAALLLGRVTYDPMPPPTHTRPLVILPERPKAADLDDLHFDTAFRGYRMDQVDEVLDQLQARLAAYEEWFAHRAGHDGQAHAGALRAPGASADTAVVIEGVTGAPGQSGSPAIPPSAGDPRTEGR
ncbi:MAG: DivIVA domain-containing protein [Tetrasphaera sp.]|nr:DivIVA domain-containing protein [Tetrasphaera sp.]